MYPKQRLDALTDGIYGVAMTLLVLDIRIPENVVVANNSELIHACLDLWSKLVPYLSSFFVLASGWLSQIRIRAAREEVTKSYAIWWAWQLLLVTGVPLTCVVLGRFIQFPFAVALYAANMALMALCGYRMLSLLPDAEIDGGFRERRLSLKLLAASSALTLALSPWLGAAALYALFLNFAAPIVARRGGRAC